MFPPKPDPVAPGQESVWDYPRPPRLERTSRSLRVEHGGVVLADSSRGWRVLETSHPPVYYLPLADVRMDLLERAAGGSGCEWKGRAVYYDLLLDGRRTPQVAWSYPAPSPAFAPIADHLGFYAGRVDGCWVDGERVVPQPGDFYGGWITPDVVGPFKGIPGSHGW